MTIDLAKIQKSIEAIEPDSFSVDGFKTLLGQMTEALKSYESRIDEMAGDLKKRDTQIAEMQLKHRMDREWVGMSSDDRYLKRFVSGEGRIVLRSSQYTPKGADFKVWQPGLLDSEAKCEWHKRFQHVWAARAVAKATLTAIGRGGETPKLDWIIAQMIKSAPAAIKKSFDDQDGSGGEWIKDQDLIPRLEEAKFGAFRLEGLVEHVSTRSGRLDLPFLQAMGVPYLHGLPRDAEPAKYKASMLTTDERAFILKGIAVRMVAASDASEDSILDTAAVLFRVAARTVAGGVEDCSINGSTAATHPDTIAGWNPSNFYGAAPAGGADDHRRGWLGYRHRAINNSATVNAAGTWDHATFVQGLEAMDSKHAVSGEIVCVPSYKAYLKMLDWDEFKTIDKAGGGATLFASNIAGAVEQVSGVPIIRSIFMVEDLESSGLYTDGSGGTSGVLFIDTSAFLQVEDARGSMSAQVEDVERGTRTWVTRRRTVLGSIQSSTTKTVSMVRNI